MAIGTSVLAACLGVFGFEPNVAQNQDVQAVMHHAFSTVPGVLWLITAGVLWCYTINKKSFSRILMELVNRRLDQESAEQTKQQLELVHQFNKSQDEAKS